MGTAGDVGVDAAAPGFSAAWFGAAAGAAVAGVGAGGAGGMSAVPRRCGDVSGRISGCVGVVSDRRQRDEPPRFDVVRVGQHSPAGLRYTQIQCEHRGGVNAVISGDLRQRVPRRDRDQ